MFTNSTILNLACTASLFAMLVDSLEFKYHSNREIERILRGFSEKSGPVRTNLYEIGKTQGGNGLWVLSLTASPAGKIGVPHVKLIGNMHGDETLGRELLLQFVEHLLENYETDSTISQLLNTTNIHILPTLNPDGFDKSSMSCEGSDIGRGVVYQNYMVDLNRNFPGTIWNNSHIIKKVAESDAVIKWMENNTFILSAALHGGALVANYPFDSSFEHPDEEFNENTPSISPDNDVFEFLAKNYSQTHKRMHLGKPCTDNQPKFDGGITNGASWYAFEGGMGDYNYAFHGCMELTLELSCCKYPPSRQLPTFWEENKQAMVAFCSHANRGLSGQIIDFDTKAPIEGANLIIVGRDMRFWSSKHTGEFWRILLPGSYTLKVEAAGYNTRLVHFSVEDFKELFPTPTFKQVRLRKSSRLKISTTTTPDETYQHSTNELEILSRTSIEENVNEVNEFVLGMSSISSRTLSNIIVLSLVIINSFI